MFRACENGYLMCGPICGVDFSFSLQMNSKSSPSVRRALVVTLRVAQPARVLDLPRLRGHRHVLEAEIRGEVLEVAHVGRVDWAAAGAAGSQPRASRPRS